MATGLPVRSVLADLTVPGSDQDVAVGAEGKIFTNIQGCIICIIEKKQPFFTLLSKPMDRVLPRFTYLFGESDIF